MRAVVIDRFGGPEQLHASEVPEPKLAPDGVRIRVSAAGVNPVDTKLRQGVQESRFPFVFPCVLGWDVAGSVDAVGPAVTAFAPGDRVLAYCRKDFVGHGAYAELVSVPDRLVVACPDDLEPVAAAGLPLAGLTADQALSGALDLQAGETVVIRGASGGVGLFAVQLARAIGAHVVAVCGAASEALVRDLGAEEFVDRSDERAVERVRTLGAHAMFDLAGGAELDAWAGAMREGGRVASILVPVEPDRWAARSVRGRYVFVRPDAGRLGELAERAADGTLRVVLAGQVDLDDAAEAHRRLEAGGVHGKLVLRS